MDKICLKNEYSSLKMDSITVTKLKALAKQRRIEGYYKRRKAELIRKLEAHSNVNEQVLISGLEIPIHATKLMNTSAILDVPILYDNSPILQLTHKFISKSMQKIKDYGNWLLDYIPQNQRWLTKL